MRTQCLGLKLQPGWTCRRANRPAFPFGTVSAPRDARVRRRRPKV